MNFSMINAMVNECPVLFSCKDIGKYSSIYHTLSKKSQKSEINRKLEILVNHYSIHISLRSLQREHQNNSLFYL